jgi:hypothetical protein
MPPIMGYPAQCMSVDIGRATRFAYQPFSGGYMDLCEEAAH